MASGNHLSEYYRAWSRLTPPLRPHADVVRAVRHQIADFSGRALLLGVTPELADVADDLVAADINHSMVVNIWPGNTALRRAIVGDWRWMAFAPASFSLCIGDGSFNVLRSGEYAVLCAELARALRPGSRVVCRAYVCPDAGDTVAAVHADAVAGRIKNFHAFKLRLGIALACEARDPNVPVTAILAAFNRLFPDRAALSRSAGWERGQIDTIDFYAASTAAYSFPYRRHLLQASSAAFVNARFVSSGTYEFAESCPLLVMERA